MFLKRLPWLLPGVCCLFSLTLLLPTAHAASSDGQIDVNFFYDTLKDEGSWFNTTQYGDVWQPYIAYKSDSWRPYTDGYWSYTDGGWMFVSNEAFGWAVYHYGRWTKLQDIGWAWVPGTEWAPAWVTWRESKPDGGGGTPAADAQVAATTTDPTTDDKNPVPPAPPAPSADNPPPPGPAAGNDNYIGWAPLPPAPVGYGPDVAYGPGVDVSFGIDPYDYCFTSYGAFGSPWLAGVIFDSDRGYYCCDHSVNITNGYYDRGRGGYRGFYNGGPDFNRLRGVTQRPIPQLALRQTTNSALARQEIRNGQFNQINGNRINVAAPRFSQANVRNGRVNFTHQGTLPVTAVGKGAPAAAANNEAYKRAQESFARQGEAVHAQNPGAGAAASAGKGAGRIATTPRAQEEERQARQQAERTGRPGGGNAPETRAGQQAVRAPGAAGQRQATRQSSHRGSSRHTSGGGEARVARQQRQFAAPRVEHESHGGGGERHGGERSGGGSGERHEGGGGGDKKKK